MFKVIMLKWLGHFELKTYFFNTFKEKKAFLKGAKETEGIQRISFIDRKDIIMGKWILLNNKDKIIKVFKSLKAIIAFVAVKKKNILYVDLEEKEVKLA